MSLLGMPKDSVSQGAGQEQEKRYALACELFRLGAFGEAYHIFSALGDDPATIVGIALCHMQAEQWEQAVACLDQALSGLKKTRPISDRPPVDVTMRLLMEREYESTGYLSPVPKDAPSLAPDYTRDAIWRLLVDCCAQLGQWDRVRTLAEALKPRRYQNVDDALNRAK